MLFKSNNRLHAAYIKTNKIRSNIIGMRRYFDEEKLNELQNSIVSIGMVEPILVSRVSDGYILIAGERRMIVAKRLGLKKVPAIVEDRLSESEMLIRSFLENSHRVDYGVFEQANTINRIMSLCQKKPFDVAKLLGISEETVEARLKLLALDSEACVVCEAAGLSEKWINRVVALPQSERTKLFFGLTNEAVDLSSRASQLRERLQMDSDEPPMRTIAIKDVRIFFNTIDRAIELMKHAGVEATSERHDFDGLIEYYIRIPSRDALARR
ncbi:MAG: ParB/RepB/Spo0J family partition protein [Oscillospiraceae bacterium]